MLFSSGSTPTRTKEVPNPFSFNLAIERLFISGDRRILRSRHLIFVSISQSRCFSFQEKEELVKAFVDNVVSISQSRCFSFQGTGGSCGPATLYSFQSRNRDAFHFRKKRNWLKRLSTTLFQSRNRDAFHFRGQETMERAQNHADAFQSRNRDAFHFRLAARLSALARRASGFNLAIERLFISGDR